MIETAYIRQHDRILPERCDQAFVEITNRAGQLHYFAVVRGVHEPSETVMYTHLPEASDVWAWLDRQGYTVVRDTDLVPPERPRRVRVREKPISQ